MEPLWLVWLTHRGLEGVHKRVGSVGEEGGRCAVRGAKKVVGRVRHRGGGARGWSGCLPVKNWRRVVAQGGDVRERERGNAVGGTQRQGSILHVLCNYM